MCVSGGGAGATPGRRYLAQHDGKPHRRVLLLDSKSLVGIKVPWSFRQTDHTLVCDSEQPKGHFASLFAKSDSWWGAKPPIPPSKWVSNTLRAGGL
jgi:hypothetical protein